VEENVGRFYVPVNNVLLVDALESFDDVLEVGERLVFGEVLPLRKQDLEVAAVAVLQEHVEVVCGS
jgi:hypothetical protein